MGALVQYRDLPGGPTELRLCDELSRHCMCTNCGMLSMSMLQDPNQHMFCETCLMDRSIKYKSDHIYCSYENQEVDISEVKCSNQWFDSYKQLKYIDIFWQRGSQYKSKCKLQSN
ncbi:hypothetical protein HPB48_000336 [Haemaphysalis longicornis]|uniref:Uncharacterized protein n=1 Tax=Haemaphysalis longicornis TaxID=44386 RepID=A0A9J6GYY7_HAELO|nr:hypothetical protein HPB48_000336 [Haemaphysalis longicornis]